MSSPFRYWSNVIVIYFSFICFMRAVLRDEIVPQEDSSTQINVHTFLPISAQLDAILIAPIFFARAAVPGFHLKFASRYRSKFIGTSPVVYHRAHDVPDQSGMGMNKTRVSAIRIYVLTASSTGGGYGSWVLSIGTLKKMSIENRTRSCSNNEYRFPRGRV